MAKHKEMRDTVEVGSEKNEKAKRADIKDLDEKIKIHMAETDVLARRIRENSRITEICISNDAKILNDVSKLYAWIFWLLVLNVFTLSIIIFF